MKKHYRKEDDCLNCGSQLHGKYCHQCGQENLHLKENFLVVITHAVADYFHFDHHFFHTMRPLLLQPGKLTNEYMAGRRAQYLHPVKMYIFISIVYFLLAFKGGHGDDVVHTTRTEGKKDSIETKHIAEVDKATDSAEYLTDTEKAKLKRVIKSSIRGDHSDTPDGEQSPELADDNFENAFLTIFTDKSSDIGYKTYEEYEEAQLKLPENKRDGFWDNYIIKKYITWQHDGVNSKKLFTEGIKHNIPKMMFLLLPLFALILKITFWRNHKFYVEHLIFSFHFHCFVFLFLAIIILLKMPLPDSWDMNGWIDLFVYGVFVWYIYRSLRTVYHRSKFRTITKMFGMSISYFITFALSMVLVAIITAFTSV